MRNKLIGGGALLLGAALVAVGLALKQETGVLRKAVFVCLECIGIG